MNHKRFAIPLLIVVFFMGGAVLAADHQEEFQRVLPLNANGTFSLKNVNGRVMIATWKDEKVEIRAVKKTKKSAENLQKVKIEVKATSDSISVDTVYPKRQNTGVSVDYDVRVPEGTRLAGIQSVNGELTLVGPFARTAASTTNGKVHVEKTSGDIDLKTTNGDVEAVNVRGAIVAQTTNGSIRIDLQTLESEVRAETTNGGISLRLSTGGEIHADLDAQTTNGSISLDVPVNVQSLEKTKHRLRGQIGRGGPVVSLKTVNGSIRLTR